MDPMPATATDADIIAVVDRWAALLEADDYQAACNLISLAEGIGWTPDTMRSAVQSYDEARPGQKVTLVGLPTDVTQRKDIDPWEPPRADVLGEVWYDLNIDGFASDLTATFDIVAEPAGLLLRLCDLHVM